jgi:hypothetical protein
MTLRKEIKRIAETATFAIDPTETTIAVAYMDRIESAAHAAIRLVLEREPSHEVACAGVNAIDETGFGVERATRVFRAMTAQLLKELE